MIPRLYDENEKGFGHNGFGHLSQCEDATVIQQMNGMYELELVYPVTGLHFAEIKKRRQILCKPDPWTREQPFRIYRIGKPMSGRVTVYARHICYDMMGIPVAPFAAQGIDTALATLQEKAAIECPFAFSTDKQTDAVKTATMKTKVPFSMWELLGGQAGSLLDTFGGEYEFDHYDVKLLTRRGMDRGVSIRYGKNLTDINQEENIAGCYTGVYPYWYSNGDETEEGYVELPEKIIRLEGEFGYERILTKDFSSEWQTKPTEEQLRKRAEKYIQDNDIGKPNVSWKVEFVALEQTEEYKGRQILERVCLGDTVTVKFLKLGIDATARAVETRYKPLLDRYESISLGKVRSNLADIVVNQQKQLDSTLNKTAMQIAVEQLTAAILGARGGSVRFLDTDGDGMQDTMYIADDPDPNLAKKVWRFNYNGWAASKNGYNGPFEFGATLEDGLLANFVTAAQLVAGTIKSQDGGKTFFLDLENGILNMQATKFSISGKTVDEIAKDKADVAEENAKAASASELKEYSETVTADIKNLQSQIDGNITTWFGSYVPSTSNAPASEWNTTEHKNQHLGDLFYIVDNTTYGGRVYRWAMSESVYSWQLVEDTEVTKALAAASKAQDTADGKRRVFVKQPIPPYDVGDLWAQGDGGDLMRCNVSRSSGSYVSSDWGRATNYIDSSSANSIAQKKVDEQTQLDIFNKLTNNGALQGLFIEDGQLYVNASYLKSGTIDASVVNVINLIAEKVKSVKGDQNVEIDGGKLEFYIAGVLYAALNSDPIFGGASLEMCSYKDGATSVLAEMHGSGFYAESNEEVFGITNVVQIGIDPETGVPYADLPRLNDMKVYWEPNGDGTFTLKGMEV